MFVRVKVIPRAKKSEIIKVNEHHLKVRLVSPPAKDRANRELTELLAKYYSIQKSAIKIVRGQHSREKFVEISFT
jgi:uncharacterized protein (TIGR00251 family)